MITVSIKSIDGAKMTRRYKTLAFARAFAVKFVGPHPEFGSTYAISDDGVCRCTVVGVTIRELFWRMTMAGVASVRSIKEARTILAAQTNNEVVITSKDGEYRVNKKGGREATAAYSSDLTDAVGTGIAMYQKGEWGAKLSRKEALRALINAVAEEFGECDHVDELLKIESIKLAFADAKEAE